MWNVTGSEVRFVKLLSVLPSATQSCCQRTIHEQCLKLNYNIIPCIPLFQNRRNPISVEDVENMRTTSSVEGLNSSVQRTFPKCTHIYKFVDALKLFEHRKCTDLLYHRGATQAEMDKKRSRDRARDAKIKLHTAALRNKEISVEQFLNEMCSRNVLPSLGIEFV